MIGSAGRLFDVAAAGLAMAVLSPVFIGLAILIKILDSGPVFYRARRVGKNGVPIEVLKFRTMVHGAADKGPGITARGDARITKVGRVLRRSKLDELPQLVNVLKGEMAIVGPRPEDPRYVELYSPEERRILSVRPGLTSAASVRYRKEEELLTGADWEVVYRMQILPEKLAIDLEYLDRRSFWSDLKIIGQTFLALFR